MELAAEELGGAARLPGGGSGLRVSWDFLRPGSPLAFQTLYPRERGANPDQREADPILGWGEKK